MKKLAMLVVGFMIGLTLNMVSAEENLQMEEREIKNVITTSNENWYVEEGEKILELEDGSYVVVPTEKKEKIEVAEVLYESTNDFYISEGEIGVTFTDGSWISANPEKNEYTFQPVVLGDYPMEFDNLNDLQYAVSNYISMNNNGYF